MGDLSTKKVIVVGGGFAGLTAATELSLHDGISVTLVEAADYLGGRVKQVRPFKGCQLLDVGAEFIHGENTTAIMLAKEFSWEFEEIERGSSFPSTCFSFIDGKLSPLNESNDMFIHVQDVCEQFFECGRNVRRSLPAPRPWSEPLPLDLLDCRKGHYSQHNADSLRDQSLKQFIDQHGNVDTSCQALIDVYYCQEEGNDLDRIGMLELSRAEDTWQYGSRNFRYKKSYHDFIHHFIKRCTAQLVDIKLNWEVQIVSWGGDSPLYVSNQKNETIYGDFILITVPLQVLKEGALSFVPSIDHYKKETLDCMEMRNGCKMFCCFNKRFWPSNLRLLYCEKPLAFTQVWTEDSFTYDGETFHVLCGFCTASVAEKSSKFEEEELNQRFLEQLDMIFGCHEIRDPATSSFVKYFFYDWGSNPFVRGCYASPVVNSYGMAEKLAEPIKQTLFFAGEATGTQGMSTVQSAIDSGKRAANEIISIINGHEPTESSRNVGSNLQR